MSKTPKQGEQKKIFVWLKSEESQPDGCGVVKEVVVFLVTHQNK